MKTRDEQRLRPLDQASVPSAWTEIERRATEVGGDSRSVLFATDNKTSPRRRITAAVVGLVLGGASLLLAFNVFQGPNDGTPSSPPGIFFPTQKEPANAYPTALATGRLKESNGCIVLNAGDTDRLLIWPNGTRLIRAETGDLRIMASDGSFFAEVGDQVALGGGSFGGTAEDVNFVEETIGVVIPPRCRVDGGYWLTSPEKVPIRP